LISIGLERRNGASDQAIDQGTPANAMNMAGLCRSRGMAVIRPFLAHRRTKASTRRTPRGAENAEKSVLRSALPLSAFSASLCVPLLVPTRPGSGILRSVAIGLGHPFLAHRRARASTRRTPRGAENAEKSVLRSALPLSAFSAFSASLCVLCVPLLVPTRPGSGILRSAAIGLGHPFLAHRRTKASTRRGARRTQRRAFSDPLCVSPRSPRLSAFSAFRFWYRLARVLECHDPSPSG
jgi:hypothetical protein